MGTTNYDRLVDAYNNFDSRPLKGEALAKFYLDEVVNNSIRSIIKTIKITDRFRKILVVGRTGCGKSTILNKISDQLKNEYHITSFSVANELNMMDLETIDVLLTIYLQLVYSMDYLSGKRQMRMTDRVLKPFKAFLDTLKHDLDIKEAEADVSLLKLISFKIKVEPESRNAIRRSFRRRIESIQTNIRGACEEITEQTKQGVLIIIDDLDKLTDEPAEKMFFKETHLLTMPEAKIIFTFPLESYYLPSFVHITDKFTHRLIPLVRLYDVNSTKREESFTTLVKLVLKRINEDLVSKEALAFMIEKSGGLLRDLVKFMQDGCKIAIDTEAEKIDIDIAKKVVGDKLNEYKRLFDFPKYQDDLQKVIATKSKVAINNNELIYLLRYLFVLEYGSEGEPSWYDAHPCLRDCF